MAKSKKTGKREFFEVKVPLTSAKIMLYGESAEALDGKNVKLDLTRNLRGKNLEMKIKVKNENGNLIGVPIGIELIGSYIRRMMRRGADYVEDSFEVACRDGRAQVKPFMITRNKVSRSVRNALRIMTRQHLEGYCKSRNFQEILSEIMINKVQKDLSIKLKKIYPLALCEIRIFELKKEKKKEDIAAQ